MTEKNSLYDKAKEEMRLSERILAELLCFKGYKEKELRRESDKLIRKRALYGTGQLQIISIQCSITIKTGYKKLASTQ